MFGTRVILAWVRFGSTVRHLRLFTIGPNVKCSRVKMARWQSSPATLVFTLVYDWLKRKKGSYEYQSVYPGPSRA